MNKRCLAVCTSYTYDFGKLNHYLHDRYKTTNYRHVIHCSDKETDIFYFSQGPIVFWNIGVGGEGKYLEEIKNFSVKEVSVSFVEDDEFFYDYQLVEKNPDKGNELIIKDDVILIPKREITILLALSFSLAQSAKLSILEATYNIALRPINIFQGPCKIWSILAKRITFQDGRDFLESSVNLHYSLLETPEFLDL
jgi:uncharacterized Rmd1/YagE family protein